MIKYKNEFALDKNYNEMLFILTTQVFTNKKAKFSLKRYAF